MKRFLPVVLLVACTHDFSTFDPAAGAEGDAAVDDAALSDGGGDARDDATTTLDANHDHVVSEAAIGDARDEPAPPCGGTCISTATSCASQCSAGMMQCEKFCGGGMGGGGNGCAHRCQDMETQCDDRCISQCDGCMTSQTCSASGACQTAVPGS